MVHKTSIIPGLSKFLDNAVLSQYPPTSLKRIVAAGALALYLQHNTNIVDTIVSNPMFSGLGVSNDAGMINIEALRDVYKAEIQKAGFLRIPFPIIGNVDFNSDDIDTLYNDIVSIDASSPRSA
jgi:hypothetical protein